MDEEDVQIVEEQMTASAAAEETVVSQDCDTTASPEAAVIDLCSSPSTSRTAARKATTTPTTTDAAASGAQNDDAPDESDCSGATGTLSLECPICLQTCIHPARLPCGHIFCFLCVKGVAYKNRRCAMCRREIPPEFLDHPQLVNGIDDICTTKATEDGYQWFYEGRNGWWQYDDRTSQDIEEAFKKGEKSCTILVAGYVYIVDLEAMLQQRQNEPTRCRRVKRDLATIPKKGVAGLRIEGNTVATDSNFASQVYQQQQHNELEHSDDAALELGLGLGLINYGLRLPSNASDFISTIAATDAAIRIASDIIGSTLAHADELSRGGGAATDTLADPAHTSGENNRLMTVSRNNGGGGALGEDLFGAAEELNDAAQNINAERNTQVFDIFEQTLNDFQVLTLRNIIDSSDEEADDNAGPNQDNASYTHRQIRF